MPIESSTRIKDIDKGMDCSKETIEVRMFPQTVLNGIIAISKTMKPIASKRNDMLLTPEQFFYPNSVI